MSHSSKTSLTTCHSAMRLVLPGDTGEQPAGTVVNRAGFPENRPERRRCWEMPIFKRFSGCQNPWRDSYCRPARKGGSVKGPIAQSVEQWIENSRVGGSNPSRATFFPTRRGKRISRPGRSSPQGKALDCLCFHASGDLSVAPPVRQASGIGSF